MVLSTANLSQPDSRSKNYVLPLHRFHPLLPLLCLLLILCAVITTVLFVENDIGPFHNALNPTERGCWHPAVAAD